MVLSKIVDINISAERIMLKFKDLKAPLFYFHTCKENYWLIFALFLCMFVTSCTVKLMFSIDPPTYTSDISSDEAQRLREAYKDRFQVTESELEIGEGIQRDDKGI